MELVAINLHRRLLNASNDFDSGDHLNHGSKLCKNETLAIAHAVVVTLYALAYIILMVYKILSSPPEEEEEEEAAAEGLKKHELQQLPMAVYRSGRGVASECTICLGDFVDGERIRILPECGHRFHVAWLVSKTSCPNCRISLLRRPPSHHVITFN